jgi:hypothetical protein
MSNSMSQAGQVVERSKGPDDEQLVVMMRVKGRVHIQHHGVR